MDFAAMVQSLVAVADDVTESLQFEVTHKEWIGSEDNGEPRYGPAVLRKAVVEYKQRSFRTPDGRDITQKASLFFPRGIRPNGAEGRNDPVDVRDIFYLPNGYTGPILSVDGVVNRITGYPFAIGVILG